MAKSLFWLSEEAWKALSPHLPRSRASRREIGSDQVYSPRDLHARSPRRQALFQAD